MARRVLIIDDETAVLMAYKRILQRNGMDVDTAETLKEATAWLTVRSYDVVISDIRLTGTSGQEGFEVLRLVKELRPGAVMVMVTAFGNPETKAEAFRLGATSYLEKPVVAEDLKKAIAFSGGD